MLFDAALPADGRSHALVRLRASGRATLSERAALTAALAGAADDFMHFESDLDELEIEQEPGDLEEIDNAGALRTAVNGLFARGEADGLSDEHKKDPGWRSRASSSSPKRRPGHEAS